MAEDFQAIFDLGDGKHISTVDTAGIALAAIQGLRQEKDAEILALKSELAEIKRILQELVAEDSN